jgi:hypothetical protein
MVKMQCRICDKIFFYSLQEVQAFYPTHCGGIGLFINFKAFENAKEKWLNYKPFSPLENIK